MLNKSMHSASVVNIKVAHLGIRFKFNTITIPQHVMELGIVFKPINL